jgi:hypothetical protein
MKVSTKFQINPSSNGSEKCTQSDMGTDGPTDRRTNIVSYRGACINFGNQFGPPRSGAVSALDHPGPV